MKKTLTINIGGNVYHIEDDAFDQLQAYLDKLNQYFACQAGGQEILQDIDSRIAELFQEKISAKQQAITIGWVDEVMHRMGNPEDFGDAEQSEKASCKTAETKTEKIRKRLYRDTENRVLGGVCSGMSAYFNIDPVLLRILFVLLVFLGAGISIVIYLIFWMVVPKAVTTAQRLEMKGEEPTITNIRKTIQDEVTEVKRSFLKINRSESLTKGREIAGEAAEALFRGLKVTGKVIAAFLGGLLILLGFIGLVAFLISVIPGTSVIHSNSGIYSPDLDLSGFLGAFINPGLVSIAILLIVLLIGIPLLAVLFIGTKLVFRYKTNNKLIGLGAFGIWLVALLAMVSITLGQVQNFSLENSASATVQLEKQPANTLYLELNSQLPALDNQETAHVSDFMIATIGGKQVLAGQPHLNLEATSTPEFSVVVKRKVRGKTNADVQQNLDQISYAVSSKDSTLFLDSYFTLAQQSKWRNQEVIVTLKVPKGKMVHLGQNLDQLYFDFENLDNLWSKEMTGKTWLMTPEGLSLKK